VFVLGGARSGKSAFGQRLAAECGEPVVYVATAAALDDEMADRIARHRAQRPPTWRTVETPSGIVGALPADLPDFATVLVEDLTLLLANLMTDDAEQSETQAIAEVQALVSLPAHVIVISNEVGLGIVPAFPLGRSFRDALGRVNQAAAAACDEVYLVVAGLPLRLK
jgi:adenosylcobinamide kinase / adenosylcobinamide-phosphate guanylyltransferase